MSCIRQQDAFARPIQLKYKGETEFNTVVGGIVTIFTGLILFLYGAQQVIFLFLSPDYSQ